MTFKQTIKFGLMAMFLTPLATGCASALSGVGGSDTFACKAPPGTTCTSVAGVYANAVANNLPGRQQRARPANVTPTDGTASEALSRTTVATKIPGVGSAIRSDPRILRIWLAPWEDSEGDLHDQAYVYVTVDSGKWLIEHNRAPIRRDFAPLKLREQPAQAKSSSQSAEGRDMGSPKPNEPPATQGGGNVQ